MSTLTATRVDAPLRATRTLYKLSEPTTSEEMKGEQFEYVVLSWGSDGDTCAFPANESGGVLDFLGFGFGVGPSRWILDAEKDSYIAACIEQHEKDGGEGTATAFEWAVQS